MTRAIALTALMMLAGCQSLPAASVPLVGRWSGPHASLELGPAGGTIEYDCAQGTIGPLAIAPGGAFVARGTHTPGHGGPVRADEVPAVFAARYSGSIHGDRMTLQGRVDNGVLLGPFELRRGAEPMLTRCL